MADTLFELSQLGSIVVGAIDAELGQTEWKGGPDSGPVVATIQSTVGDMIAAGTQTGVTVTYDSEAGSLNFAAEGVGATTFLGLSDIPDTAEEGQIAVYRDGTFVFEAKPTASGQPSWGDLDGDIASQTDLADALDGKADAATAVTSDPTGIAGFSRVTAIYAAESEAARADYEASGAYDPQALIIVE